jgi:hypothetical protein
MLFSVGRGGESNLRPSDSKCDQALWDESLAFFDIERFDAQATVSVAETTPDQ